MMDKYLLQVIIFISVLFAQIESETNDTSTSLSSTMLTSTSDSSISSSMITTILTSSSISYSPSIEMTPSSSSHSTSAVTNGSIPSVANETFITSTYTTSTDINSSGKHSSSSPTSTSSTDITSTLSTRPITNDTRLIYKYLVTSSSPLKIGNITNSTVLTAVQNMVQSSFNLPNFIITVIRIEIRSRAKSSSYENDMITDILFQSNRTDCNLACIKSSALSSNATQSFPLPDVNNTLVNVTARLSPTLVGDVSGVTAAPINYKKGESPPGVAAKLGMGFGISIISILLIGEIIYFYRKYGLTLSTHRTNYELTVHNRRLSV